MDTLRESATSLRRATAEYDTTALKNNAGHTHEGKPRVWEPSSAFGDAQANVVSPVVETETEAQARFARNYANPLFPCQFVAYTPVKRFFDIFISLLVLLAAAPIMLATALAIRLTSRGPIMFKQVRVGRGGRHFWCYKFRSMCVDAEQQKEMLMHLNEASGPVFKIKRDPRVTKVGAFIRKLSIDELPQLFNVLKGDMSIVGPRPPLPKEVACYGPRERGRLAVQPGLTCLWQIGGRSNVSFERWVELDLLYIETMSFSNDVKIFLMTIPAVLKGSGAH